jgi:hypothetical protein
MAEVAKCVNVLIASFTPLEVAVESRHVKRNCVWMTG